MTPEVEVHSLQFVRVFPWLRLGRALGCALAPTQLLLAITACLAWALIAEPLFREAPLTAEELEARPDSDIAVANWHWERVVRPDEVAPPVWQVLRPMLQRSILGRGTWRGIAGSAVAYLLWTLAGVAIARCAAVQFCRDAGPSLRDSVKWSVRRCVPSLTAILIPLGFVLLAGILMLLLALPGSFPGLGGLWLRLTAPVQILLALSMATVLVLLPLLWPLLVAAIAIDGSDAFDAFSRSFSLVTSRPWSTLVLCLLCGAAAWIAANLLDLVEVSSSLCVSAWGGPVLGVEREAILRQSTIWWGEIFVTGFLSSLFWTHAAIVYLFLRQAVDRTPLDTLAGYEDDTRFHEPFPVVGIPAVDPPAVV